MYGVVPPSCYRCVFLQVLCCLHVVPRERTCAEVVAMSDSGVRQRNVKKAPEEPAADAVPSTPVSVKKKQQGHVAVRLYVALHDVAT